MNITFSRGHCVLAAVVLFGIAGCASNDTASPRASAANDNGPGTHTAGSQIRLHEGVKTTAKMVPMDGQPQGLDVSGWQGNVDWGSVAANGAAFAYIKATEGTGYTNSYFAQQYNGSYDNGIIRGAYHFATPDTSSGADQANFFVDNGGGWSADGMTMPPMLDIEYNPYGSECYGLSQDDMVAWIHDFADTIKARTTRDAVIYTTTNWWTSCTGNDPGFGQTNPLFIANYSGSPYPLPAGWDFYTLWQYNDSGVFPGDQDVFNGPSDRLQVFATDSQ